MSTKIRKRARALRRMERKEAERYSTGGWVDDRIPEADVDRILTEFGIQTDHQAFKTFLRSRVGRFRSMKEWQDRQPTNAEEATFVEETMEVIQELRKRLGNLPPDTSAHINSISWKRSGKLFFDHKRRIDADLREAWMMLAMTERELDQQKGKIRGRKRESLRDSFLSDVAERLVKDGLSELRAFEATYQLCLPLQVEVPEYVDDDPGKFAAIIRGWRKHRAGWGEDNSR